MAPSTMWLLSLLLVRHGARSGAAATLSCIDEQGELCGTRYTEQHCNHTIVGVLTRERCAKMCKVCAPPPEPGKPVTTAALCQDRVNGCGHTALSAAMCQNEKLGHLIRSMCPLSCGVCSHATAAATPTLQATVPPTTAAVTTKGTGANDGPGCGTHILVGMCTHALVGNYTRNLCPTLCGPAVALPPAPSPADCQDLDVLDHPGCGKHISLSMCTNAIVGNYSKRVCPVMCGQCTRDSKAGRPQPLTAAAAASTHQPAAATTTMASTKVHTRPTAEDRTTPTTLDDFDRGTPSPTTLPATTPVTTADTATPTTLEGFAARSSAAAPTDDTATPHGCSRDPGFSCRPGFFRKAVPAAAGGSSSGGCFVCKPHDWATCPVGQHRVGHSPTDTGVCAPWPTRTVEFVCGDETAQWGEGTVLSLNCDTDVAVLDAVVGRDSFYCNKGSNEPRATFNADVQHLASLTGMPVRGVHYGQGGNSRDWLMHLVSEGYCRDNIGRFNAWINDRLAAAIIRAGYSNATTTAVPVARTLAIASATQTALIATTSTAPRIATHTATHTASASAAQTADARPFDDVRGGSSTNMAVSTPATAAQRGKESTVPVPAADDCTAIKCALFCKLECGWSRLQDKCIWGETTSASETVDRLGDCPSVATAGTPLATSTAAPVDASSTAGEGNSGHWYALIAGVSVPVVLALLLALALRRRTTRSETATLTGADSVHFTNPTYRRPHHAADGELYVDRTSTPACGVANHTGALPTGYDKCAPRRTFDAMLICTLFSVL